MMEYLKRACRQKRQSTRKEEHNLFQAKNNSGPNRKVPQKGLFSTSRDEKKRQKKFFFFIFFYFLTFFDVFLHLFFACFGIAFFGWFYVAACWKQNPLKTLIMGVVCCWWGEIETHFVCFSLRTFYSLFVRFR